MKQCLIMHGWLLWCVSLLTFLSILFLFIFFLSLSLLSLSLSPLLSLFSSSFFFLLSSLLFHSSLPLSLSLLPLLSTLLSPLSYFLILQAQFYLSGYYLEDMAVTIPNTYNSYLALFAALPAALAEAQGVKFRIFFLLF